MRIALTISSFRGGGITSYALEFIKNYSRENKLYVVVGDDSCIANCNYNIDIYRIEGNDLSTKNTLNFISLINETIKPDILVNSNSQVAAFSIPFLATNIKVITISHSLKYVEADIAAFNHKYIDSIVALSYYNKEYLERKFHIADKEKCQVVYNFVEDGENVQDLLKEKRRALIPNIVYMGGSSGAKNPVLVFKIVKELLNTDLKFKFYWLGVDTPPLQKMQPFKTIADLLPLDNRIVFTHRIPRSEAMKICSKANVILIPSKREGCPMALLETMRYGVISVTSDYKNACRELIKDNINGRIIPHTETNSFVDCIKDIILHTADYDYMYENSLKTFNRQLSFNAWRLSMDNLIYDKKPNHIMRISTFSPIRFKTNKLLFSILNFQNKINKFFHETFPAAIYFLVQYVKKRK